RRNTHEAHVGVGPSPGLRPPVQGENRWAMGLALKKAAPRRLESDPAGIRVGASLRASRRGVGGVQGMPRMLARGHTQETEMRDVAESTMVSTARLTRGLDEHECRRRNALSRSIPGFALRSGDVGTVLETLGD